MTTTAGVLRYEHAFMRGVCGMPEVQVVLRLADAYQLHEGQVTAALSPVLPDTAPPDLITLCRGCARPIWRRRGPAPQGWLTHKREGRCATCTRKHTRNGDQR